MRLREVVGVGISALWIAACGGKSATTIPQTVAQPPVKVSTATALRWPKNFCALTPGASKAHILAVMGPATDSGTDAAGFPNLGWSAMGYEFSVDFDKSGKTSTMLEVLPDLESAQDPRLKTRLHNCPYLIPSG